MTRTVGWLLGIENVAAIDRARLSLAAAWAEDGRDTRRPLILCEYNHAMGQAGGLGDYWALFGRHGLQGGFVWEWCDHALRRVGMFVQG